MASAEEKAESEDTKKYPAVAMYGPCNVRGLEEGEKKKWCTCGLSKKQPWCDGAHKGTGFKSLKWKVPKQQTLHQLCACKHTQSPPYCDGTHNNLPTEVLHRQKTCQRQASHTGEKKLCTGCGWVPDF